MIRHGFLIAFLIFSIVLFPTIILAENKTIVLTHAEQDWLDQKHKVRVRVGNWPPFMFSENGFKGISVDYIKKIFGLHGIEYEFISDKKVPWKEALKDIEKHRVIDLLLTAKITEERKKHMVFTDEYLFLPWVIFCRADSPFIGGMADLAGKTVCVPEGYVMHGLLEKNYPEINLYLMAGASPAPSCVSALAHGKVDAYVGNLAVGSFVIQSKGYVDLKVAAPTPFGTHNQAMAVRDDWPELASIISKTLKSFSPSEHAEIRNKWLSVRYEYGIRPKDVIKWISSIASILIALILLILFWNRKLNQEIFKRQSIELQLRESENKYRSLSDAAFEGIIILDEGKIVDGNQAAVNMFGSQSPSDFIGKQAIDFICPEDREEVQYKMSVGYDKPYEIRCLKIDGSLFPIEVQGKMFSFKGKQVRVTAIRDLTNQKKAEDEIKKLQGIIPICMHCKGIRDDKGYWNQLEKYLSEHSDVQFSHGICDKCVEKLYPGLKNKK